MTLPLPYNPGLRQKQLRQTTNIEACKGVIKERKLCLTRKEKSSEPDNRAAAWFDRVMIRRRIQQSAAATG